jgi:drug/metabolite transporter (DMT)-like permease
MKRQSRAELFIFASTFLWGSAFIFLKQGLIYFSPWMTLAIRFSVSALFFLPFCLKYFYKINSTLIKDGCWLAFLTFTGFVLQTVGLLYTTTSHSAFITSTMVIFTLFFDHLFSKHRPEIAPVIGIGIILIGLWLLISPSQTGVNTGDLLTLLGAVLFGLYIVELGRISKRHPPSLLIFVVMTFCSVYALIGSGDISSVFLQQPSALLGLLILAILGTATPIYIQMRYQKETTPTRTAIIFTIEPVWAGILGYLVFDERMGFLGMAGGGLIIVGILIAELWKKPQPNPANSP